MQNTNRKNTAYYILAVALFFLIMNLLYIPIWYAIAGFNATMPIYLILPGILIGCILILFWLLLKNPESFLSKAYDRFDPPAYAVFIIVFFILLVLSKLLFEGVFLLVQM